MDQNIKNIFMEKWNNYFPSAELPIVFFYTDEYEEDQNRSSSFHCIFDELSKARSGSTVVFHKKTPMCAGGKRYLGFSETLRPNFEYFLSCGIPGKMQGERYKKTPEIVKEIMKDQPPFNAPGKYIVFKRWDKLSLSDEPTAVIFFAPSDIISGLFTLCNFNETDRNAVISPFGSGCSSIVFYPLKEAQSKTPKSILGLFDVSARKYISSSELTLTVPYRKFIRMINDMEESFLITDSWKIIKDRIEEKTH